MSEGHQSSPRPRATSICPTRLISALSPALNCFQPRPSALCSQLLSTTQLSALSSACHVDLSDETELTPQSSGEQRGLSSHRSRVVSKGV